MIEYIKFRREGESAWQDSRLWGMGGINWHFPAAEPKTKYIDIPGRDGILDVTETSGAVKYSNVEGEISFHVIDKTKFDLSNFINTYQGKRVEFLVDHDSEHFRVGRMTVSDDNYAEILRKLTLSVNADPFRYSVDDIDVTVPTIAEKALAFVDATTTTEDEYIEINKVTSFDEPYYGIYITDEVSGNKSYSFDCSLNYTISGDTPQYLSFGWDNDGKGYGGETYKCTALRVDVTQGAALLYSSVNPANVGSRQYAGIVATGNVTIRVRGTYVAVGDTLARLGAAYIYNIHVAPLQSVSITNNGKTATPYCSFLTGHNGVFAYYASGIRRGVIESRRFNVKLYDMPISEGTRSYWILGVDQDAASDDAVSDAIRFRYSEALL